MADIIKLKHEQIIRIDKHGIYFINNENEEDFLSFLLCYESLARLAGSDRICKAPKLRANSDKYEHFLSQLCEHLAIGIYDDINYPYESTLLLWQSLSQEILIYQLEFDTSYKSFETDICEQFSAFQQEVQQFGWQIALTSKIF